ncbi:unnamed protein product [Urochloa humidicola]
MLPKKKKKKKTKIPKSVAKRSRGPCTAIHHRPASVQPQIPPASGAPTRSMAGAMSMWETTRPRCTWRRRALGVHRRPASVQPQIPPATGAPPGSTAGGMWESTRPRCTWRRRAAAPALPVPEELVVWEILIRLPAKALLRCRAVCRSWRRLTTDAEFLLAHHRRQPSLPLVVFHGQICVSGNAVADATLDAFDLRAAPAAAKRNSVLHFHDSRHCRAREFKVYASCDGLLLCSLCNPSLHICNPTTRQLVTLPMSLVGTIVAALYRHSSSGEYRVLYMKRIHPGVNSAYYILNVGNSEPRRVGLPVPAASVTIKQYIAAGLLSVSEHPPVLLHSCLHWIFYSSQENALVVFDTISESFRHMSPPTAENGRWPHLLDMDGALGISHTDERKMMVKLWVLQDHETEVWSLKYQIELPMVELRGAGMDCRFEVSVVSEKGDVLVCCSSSGHIFHCDKKGKLLEKFQCHSVLSMPIGHWFKESLVRHAFFQGLDNDLAVHLFQGS